MLSPKKTKILKKEKTKKEKYKEKRMKDYDNETINRGFLLIIPNRRP